MLNSAQGTIKGEGREGRSQVMVLSKAKRFMNIIMDLT
jgi:hypothetical protein